MFSFLINLQCLYCFFVVCTSKIPCLYSDWFLYLLLTRTLVVECPKLNKFVNLNVTVTQLAKTAAFQAILLSEVWAKYSATTCFFQHEKLIIKWQVTGEFFLNIQVFRPEFHSERLPILYYECIKTNKKWVAFWYPN